MRELRNERTTHVRRCPTRTRAVRVGVAHGQSNVRWRTVDRTAAAVAVDRVSPRDVWLLRDYLDAIITAAGRTPHPYTSVTEQMRSAADTWFGLVDVQDVLNGAPL
ncbi:DUF2316 family protein [Curtobacterium sp. Curtsp57]|jgi:hypothetical protein|uniref:DUF2316 family protein n=1 Tax=Curtobacterium sp. Curtsp57 TaxID=3243047 RepID=UPI0039B653E3